MTDRCPQQPAERLLLLVVEVVLAADEHHLVPQQRPVDRVGGGAVEIATQPYPVDLRTDAAAPLGYRDRCDFRGRGHGSVLSVAPIPV